MKNSAYARRFHPNTAEQDWAARVSLSGPAQPVLRASASHHQHAGDALQQACARCQTTLLPTSIGPPWAAFVIMIKSSSTGSGFSAVLSSILHALLEGLDALRDIAHQSEILPRRKTAGRLRSRRSSAKLSEPILQPSKHAKAGDRPGLYRKLGSAGVQNKDLGRVKSLLSRRLGANVNRTPRGGRS